MNRKKFTALQVCMSGFPVTVIVILVLLCSSCIIWFYNCGKDLNKDYSSNSSLVDYAKTFRTYILNEDYESAKKLMAPDARRWWETRSGEGEPWIIEPGNHGPWSVWDDHFRTKQQILEWKEKENSVVLVVRETNDYFQLLERGWVSNEITYYFDQSGRINGLLIRAIGERPKGRTEEFLAWAKENAPTELEILMPGGEIDPSGDHPQCFRRLLNRWRMEDGHRHVGPYPY